MPSAAQAGPSGTAAWEERTVEAGLGRSLVLRALPDADNPRRLASGWPNLWHVALKQPQLATGGDGTPVFSLSVVLRRRPLPGEDQAPLIERGLLAFEPTLAAPPWAREILGRDIGGECVPIFARSGLFQLVSSVVAALGDTSEAPERVIAESEASGSAVRAALVADLAAAEVFALVAALEGGATTTGLVVRGAAEFRAVAPDRTLHLTGSFAEIHDRLRDSVDETGLISESTVRRAFESFMGTTVRVREILPTGSEVDLAPPAPEEAWRLFRSSVLGVLLSAVAAGETTPSNPVFRLQARPNPSFMLDASRHVAGTGAVRRLAGEADIADLLPPVRNAGTPREAFVHVVFSDAAQGGVIAPAPRSDRTVGGSRRSSPTTGRVALALRGDQLHALGAVLKPGAKTGGMTAATSLDDSAAAMLLSDTTKVRPIDIGIRQGWIDDLVLSDGSAVRDNLPLVADASAPYWRDRSGAGQAWYAPVFELAPPAPNGDPATSPFLFEYERTGVTAAGRPALRASLRLSIRPTRSAQTEAALTAAGLDPLPVPTLGLSAAIRLPFVDEADGRTRSQHLPARVTADRDGTFTVELELLNEWVGLCYGALARAGFQAEPLRLVVTYSFPAWVPVSRAEVAAVLGGKIALTPVVRHPDEVARFGGHPYFDAGELAVRHDAGEFRFLREPTQQLQLATEGGATLRGSAGAVAALRPRPLASSPAFTNPAVRPAGKHPMLIVRPELRPSEVIGEILVRAEHARQTLVRETSGEVLLPCAEFGALYRERGDGVSRAIGCRDALMLGQAENRAYEEMPELASPRSRVFRSLQQPDRFLVLPARYRVARYDASAGATAFGPAIALYAVLDPEDDARSRVVVEASLEPDLPPFSRRELKEALSAHARVPSLDFPTEIARDIRFDWSLPAALAIEPQALRVPNGFRASLASDLMGALLLRDLLANSDVSAGITFVLSDGAELPSLLEINLRELAGPWTTGPLTTTLVGTQLDLANRIERPVDLVEVIVCPAAGASTRVPAETRLEVGGAWHAVLPEGTTAALPVYTIPPGPPVGLEENRSVIDEIRTNVIFVDLINYAEHALVRLAIRARLRDVPGVFEVAMDGSPGRGAVDMVLPLTTYLAQRVLEFEVRKTFASGRSEATPWLAWDLTRDGNIVSLTWNTIAAVT